MFDYTGSIQQGKQADLVLLNQNNEIDLVFTQGQITYYPAEN
ncbi:MAG: amidohydrolase family protein [Spirochaetaceae bacterium]|nr:amidohydrolase family protein [Spirochaetaceae bacterium]